ncbi:unnamed protein product [Orchesella dallaii]|uniref:C2H2-type domain-containing protein n=1 Tax=Orchesella dallaii TaxID=48710 RepID=A0ABP1PMT9_9HEXA
MEQVPADTSHNIWIRMAEDDDFELDPSTFAEISKQQELKRKPSLLNNSLSSSSHRQLNINQQELIDLVSKDDEVSNHDDEDHPAQPRIGKCPSFLSPSNLTDNQKDNHSDLQLVSPSSVNKEVPPYTKFTKGRYTYYQCTKCPAHQRQLGQLRKHLQLHKKGSLSIPCPDCGWLVLPRLLAQHQSQHHRETNPNYSIGKRMGNVRNYKCKHCPAFSKHLLVMQYHAKLHFDGAQVWICEVNNCGWFVNPRKISSHLCRFHRYKCDECPAVYFTVTGLSHHRKVHRTSEGSKGVL